MMQVHFDACAADFSATPTVLLSTDDGVLFGTSAESSVGSHGTHKPSGLSELVRTPNGLLAFAVEPSSGKDVFCLTDAECLLYLHRTELS
jgi:hypothetical protein